MHNELQRIAKVIKDPALVNALGIFALHKLCTTLAALFSLLLSPSLGVDLPRDHAVDLTVRGVLVDAWRGVGDFPSDDLPGGPRQGAHGRAPERRSRKRIDHVLR